MKQRQGKKIPIKVAQEIADKYGYDQVVIVARLVDEKEGQEWCTTYGRNKEHCKVAARMGPILKALNNGEAKVMWLNGKKPEAPASCRTKNETG